jgi:hypothetical protein
MRRQYIVVAFCFVATFFFQCQKDLSHFGEPDITNIVTPDPVTSNLQGNVFDENGNAAAGVTVRVGGKTAVTDSKGYFRINGASLDKKSALVTAEKAGYFKAYRSFAATAGTNQVVFKLIPKQLAGTINAATGGEVSLSNGSKVVFPANGIVTASNSAAYTGTVNVYMSYIDPSAADIADRVPGSFMANDKDGNRVSLTSYGMVAVELESGAGVKLQIKQGSSATLTTAIPAAAQPSAPATIALWSIDEITGIWKEEGTATKNGGLYTGTVSHFSYWNCDVPGPSAYVSLTLKNSAGAPLVYTRVQFSPLQGWGAAYGITDSLGHVCGLVPLNMPLTLKVNDECGGIIYSQNVGPFTAATNLGVITVSNSSNRVVTVSGKLLNCANAAVTNGYAVITTGAWVRYAATDASGNFSTTFVICGTTLPGYTVIGVDNGAQQQGASVSGNLTAPATPVGNVSACGTSSAQYINYTYDGISYTVGANLQDSLVGFTSTQGGMFYTYISASQLGTVNQFSVNVQHASATAGTYPASYISVRGKNSAMGNASSVTFTNFPPAAGQFYEGSVSGNFTDSSSVTHTVSATFRVRRL